jgi:predicted RNase H-like HicB family nuclease
MKEFVALIHHGPDGSYEASFPDLPGVVVPCETLEQARVQAQYTLFFHIHGLVAAGADIPQPSSLEVIMADQRHRDALETMTLPFVEVNDDAGHDEDDVYGKDI